MASITVPKQKILGALSINEQIFEKQLFDFGVELEETETLNGVQFYKLDISANRFDLLCTEGIINAFSSYCNGKKYYDTIQVARGNRMVKVEGISDRPYIHAFVLYKVYISSIPSLIEYQETLHKNLGRNRKNMSMGLHTLDKISFPVKYCYGKKEDVFFNPLRISQLVKLEENTKISLKKCDEILKQDKILSKYLTNSAKSPYFVDSKNLVLSYPPILNCEETKLELDDSNNQIDIFVEITGDDRKKIEDTVVYLIGNFGTKGVEEVTIEHPKDGSEYGTSSIYDLINKKHHFELTPDYIHKHLNITLNKYEIKKYLEKMMHGYHEENNSIIAEINFIRRDVLGIIDLIEDIAIAHTLDKFKMLKIPFSTVGKELFSSVIENKIREESAFSGFNEVLNLTLLSEQENSFGYDITNEKNKLFFERLTVTENESVKLLNPKSAEYQVVRTSILPGLLKSIKNNMHYPLPMKIFESGEICLVNENVSHNKKRFGAVIAGLRDHLEDLIGFINQIFYKMNLKCMLEEYNEKEKYHNFIRKDVFLAKRGGKITINDGIIVGMFGVINPDILKSFGIFHAVSAVELDLDLITDIIGDKSLSS